jgi:hypothetical protein
MLADEVTTDAGPIQHRVGRILRRSDHCRDVLEAVQFLRGDDT